MASTRAIFDHQHGRLAQRHDYCVSGHRQRLVHNRQSDDRHFHRPHNRLSDKRESINRRSVSGHAQLQENDAFRHAERQQLDDDGDDDRRHAAIGDDRLVTVT